MHVLTMCIYNGDIYAHIDISVLYLSRQIKNLFATNPILLSEKQLYSVRPHLQGQICLLNNLNISSYTIGSTNNCSPAHGFMETPPLSYCTLTEKIKYGQNQGD